MTEKQDDLNLPAAVVSRIIKDALPEGCNVAKEAKLALSRAASVFVLYITAQANSVATQKNRKTITNSDVLEALQLAEFTRFEAPLAAALSNFMQEQKDKKDRKSTNQSLNKTPDAEEDAGELEIEETMEVTS